MARQPSVSSSTSSARSSTRALRSDSIVASMLLEPADRVVREALDLGQAAGDRRGFLAQAVAQGFTDLVHEREATVRTGWTPASSTTTCRRS